MNLMRWRDDGFNPARELARLQDEMGRLFDYESGFENAGLFDRNTSPAMDVIEKADEYVAVCDLPGVEEKDLDISVANNVLTLKGEKRPQEKRENAKVYRREEWSGTFQRTLSLPRGVDAEKISAELKNGVLRVVLPKREEEKPRRVEVSVQ